MKHKHGRRHRKKVRDLDEQPEDDVYVPAPPRFDLSDWLILIAVIAFPLGFMDIYFLTGCIPLPFGSALTMIFVPQVCGKTAVVFQGVVNLVCAYGLIWYLPWQWSIFAKPPFKFVYFRFVVILILSFGIPLLLR